MRGGFLQRSYRWVQRYRAEGKRRGLEVKSFLELMLLHLGQPRLFDSAGTEVTCEERVVDGLIEDAFLKSEFPECGVDFDIIAGEGRPEDVCRFEFHVGTAAGEVFVDFFALQYAEGISPINDQSLLEKLIKIGTPFEAFLGENNNEFDLRAKKRQNRIPGYSRPAIIRGFHYLGGDLVESLGGEQVFADAPVFSVARVVDGILLRLNQDVFDPSDPGHVDRQNEAMAYFDIS